MTNNQKVFLFSILLWVINLKIFFLLSNWSQIIQIAKYSSGVGNFMANLYEFYFVFVTTIPTITLLLTMLFVILLYVFWFYYFMVYFHKLVRFKTEETGFFGLFATFFTFLGFGCVACGQTLLSSIIFLFISNGTMYLAEFIGNMVIVIGILLLCYGIYRNYTIYHNKNICKIEGF